MTASLPPPASALADSLLAFDPAADLPGLDARIDQLRQQLDVLERVRLALSGAAPAPEACGEPPPGNAPAGGHADGTPAVRERIARLLLRDGPAPAKAIAAAVGTAPGKVALLMQCPLFERADAGLLSPYRLTPAGRRFAEKLPPAGG